MSILHIYMEQIIQVGLVTSFLNFRLESISPIEYSTLERKSQQAQIFKIIWAECVYELWIEVNNWVFVKWSRQV